MDGAIIVDKPEGWTSHDVVNKMRRIAGTKRVGHLGTLDPMATGVLPLVIGRATRLAQFYMKNDKRYDAVVRFGHSTDSYDRQGEPGSPHVDVTLDLAEIEPLLADYRGTIMQTPPVISAKKIQGTPAYKLARKKVDVEMKPVEVTIHELRVVGCEDADLRLHVHCSTGTYLRSLAHDLGKRLGCGAFIQELRRTASGEFSVEQARTLPVLEALSKEGRIAEALLPAASMLPEFPGEIVDQVTATQIRQGRDFRVSPFRVSRGAKYVKALSPDGGLLAIGEVRLPNLYHPILVL